MAKNKTVSKKKRTRAKATPKPRIVPEHEEAAEPEHHLGDVSLGAPAPDGHTITVAEWRKQQLEERYELLPYPADELESKLAEEELWAKADDGDEKAMAAVDGKERPRRTWLHTKTAGRSIIAQGEHGPIVSRRSLERRRRNPTKLHAAGMLRAVDHDGNVIEGFVPEGKAHRVATARRKEAERAEKNARIAEREHQEGEAIKRGEDNDRSHRNEGGSVDEILDGGDKSGAHRVEDA